MLFSPSTQVPTLWAGQSESTPPLIIIHLLTSDPALRQWFIATTLCEPDRHSPPVFSPGLSSLTSISGGLPLHRREHAAHFLRLQPNEESA